MYEFTFSPKKRVAIIDFMAQARKIESRRKKFNIKTFGDAVNYIWNSILQLARYIERIDIVFDCYSHDSIKGIERQRRAKDQYIRTFITHLDQPLPIPSELDQFWASSENTIAYSMADGQNFVYYFILVLV